jgi:mRNA deadenylase 3'-5' endonuclease subunit Ccr4
VWLLKTLNHIHWDMKYNNFKESKFFLYFSFITKISKQISANASKCSVEGVLHKHLQQPDRSCSDTSVQQRLLSAVPPQGKFPLIKLSCGSVADLNQHKNWNMFAGPNPR